MPSLHTIEVQAAETLLRVSVLLSLVVAVAFFVAAELAIVSASKPTMARLAQQRDRLDIQKNAERVCDAQTHLSQYLAVTQTGTTAGSLLLGWLGEGATVHWIEPWIARLPIGQFPAMLTAHSIAITVAFLLVTYVEIVLGELIPKVLAAQEPERTALWLIRPLQICAYLLSPALVVFNATVRLLIGWIPKPASDWQDVWQDAQVSEAISVSESLFNSVAAGHAADQVSTEPIPQLSNPLSSLAWSRMDAHSVMILGSVTLPTLNQELSLNLPLDLPYRTIAGFMIHQLGRMPLPGECLQWDDLELEAMHVLEQRLETIVLRRVTQPWPEFPITSPSPVIEPISSPNQTIQ